MLASLWEPEEDEWGLNSEEVCSNLKERGGPKRRALNKERT